MLLKNDEAKKLKQIKKVFKSEKMANFAIFLILLKGIEQNTLN